MDYSRVGIGPSGLREGAAQAQGAKSQAQPAMSAIGGGQPPMGVIGESGGQPSPMRGAKNQTMPQPGMNVAPAAQLVRALRGGAQPQVGGVGPAAPVQGAKNRPPPGMTLGMNPSAPNRKPGTSAQLIKDSLEAHKAFELKKIEDMRRANEAIGQNWQQNGFNPLTNDRP